MWLILQSVLLLPIISHALPTNIAKSGAISANFDSGIPPLFTFDGGNVGVNFLGYRASAGLGGLLTGNAADGGLHAEAGTPFGQSAGAGLGGVATGEGRAAGGLYAGATAGGGISAGAGLAGTSGSTGSSSTSFAGASAGGVGTSITKIAHKPATSGKLVAVIPSEVEVLEEKPKTTTYVQRTVIPNYVEKKIQVPTYVEKTIRVPTTVEKTIRVPAEPTIVEKTVEVPVVHQTPAVVYVNKGFRRPVYRRRFWHKNIGFGGGYGGAASGAYTASFAKAANPQLINDIFNIPISTLKAVNQLVGGLAGGASGSLAVSKSVAVGK